MTSLPDQLSRLQQTVAAWDGITASPHRFGGIEFNLGAVEVGHVHLNGMVDIPFNSKLRNQLIAERRALPHHLLKDTGWISFYVRSEADVDAAIWLFRLSYLFHASRRAAQSVLSGPLDVSAALDALAPTDALRAIFSRVVRLDQSA